MISHAALAVDLLSGHPYQPSHIVQTHAPRHTLRRSRSTHRASLPAVLDLELVDHCCSSMLYWCADLGAVLGFRCTLREKEGRERRRTTVTTWSTHQACLDKDVLHGYALDTRIKLNASPQPVRVTLRSIAWPGSQAGPSLPKSMAHAVFDSLISGLTLGTRLGVLTHSQGDRGSEGSTESPRRHRTSTGALVSVISPDISDNAKSIFREAEDNCKTFS